MDWVWCGVTVCSPALAPLPYWSRASSARLTWRPTVRGLKEELPLLLGHTVPALTPGALRDHVTPLELETCVVWRSCWSVACMDVRLCEALCLLVKESNFACFQPLLCTIVIRNVFKTETVFNLKKTRNKAKRYCGRFVITWSVLAVLQKPTAQNKPPTI